MGDMGEFWREARRDRQRRRAKQADRAFDKLDEIRSWCEASGVGLSLKNMGSHWKFAMPSGAVVNWWPSSCTAHLDRRDGKHRGSCHVNDWQHLRKALLQKLLEEEG